MCHFSTTLPMTLHIPSLVKIGCVMGVLGMGGRVLVFTVFHPYAFPLILCVFDGGCRSDLI